MKGKETGPLQQTGRKRGPAPPKIEAPLVERDEAGGSAEGTMARLARAVRNLIPPRLPSTKRTAKRPKDD
jgi:hypothetical protein